MKAAVRTETDKEKKNEKTSQLGMEIAHFKFCTFLNDSLWIEEIYRRACTYTHTCAHTRLARSYQMM